MRRVFVALLFSALSLSNCGPPPPPPPPPTNLPMTSVPTTDAPTPSRTRRVVPTRERPTPQLPPGFSLTPVFEEFELPTTVVTDGTAFYVSELKRSRILKLRDSNGDGILDDVSVYAKDLDMPRGLAFQPGTGTLYVSTRGQVLALYDTDGDGNADSRKTIVDNLADYDISHSNNGIAFEPTGKKLFITDGAPRIPDMTKQGDTWLFENKPLHPFAGTILSANPDGSDAQVYARGFRNPFDLIFAPDGKLYATDNGEDTIAAEFQGDELNLIIPDGDYGYPGVTGPPPPEDASLAPLINFPADSSSDGLVYYTGTRYPEEYRNNIYIALYAAGRSIVRAVQDSATGKWAYKDFVTNLDRPIDLIQGSDGLLYFLDMNTGNRRNTSDPDHPGILYRVDYTAP